MDGRVRARNVSSTLPALCGDGAEVRPGEACELPLPVHLGLGRKLVAIEEGKEPSVRFLPQRLGVRIRPPGVYTVSPFLYTPDILDIRRRALWAAKVVPAPTVVQG